MKNFTLVILKYWKERERERRDIVHSFMPAFKYSIALIINRKSIVTVGTQRFFFDFSFFLRCAEKIINNFFDYFSIEEIFFFFLFDSQSTVLCLILKSLIYTKNFYLMENLSAMMIVNFSCIENWSLIAKSCFEIVLLNVFHFYFFLFFSAWTSTCAG